MAGDRALARVGDLNGGRTEAAAGNARGAAGGGAFADHPIGVIQDWIESMGTEWMVRLRAAALTVLLLAGCSAPRVPFTAEEQAAAQVPGMHDIRFWADTPPDALRPRAQELARSEVLRTSPNFDLLALSGGGADGAFGAGFLTGWSEAGDRPEFTVVTGVSVGALIAPFAFLGPSRDRDLRAVFAEGAAGELAQFRGPAGLLGSGLVRPEPLRDLIARYADERMLADVAAEHARGRRLLVLTTNLDAQRAVIWDLGAIATSGHPRALGLFRSALAASASVPGVFPPVMIEVEAFGRRFSEMHVDGGVTGNLLVVPEALLRSHQRLFPHPRPGRLFVLMNNTIEPDFGVVENGTLQVAARAFSTAVSTNTGTVLRGAYGFARRHGLEFNLARIVLEHPGAIALRFDQGHMRRLFEHGYESGRRRDRWERELPLLRAQEPGVHRRAS